MSTSETTAPAATEAAPSVVLPRFAEALQALGLGEVTARVRKFPEATRTAEEAAAAVGCELNAIVKSLIFAAHGLPGSEGPVPVLVLLDGASRADLDQVRDALGASKVTRAKADLVRETTGYAIGGVPPFGHRTRTPVLADRRLLAHPEVWAAAGTPHTVFPMAPAELVRHAGASLVDVRESSG